MKKIKPEELRQVTGHKKWFVDLTGKKFGKLTVIGIAGNDRENRIVWECLCSGCGSKCLSYTTKLKIESFQSCGCDRVNKRGVAPRREMHGMKWYGKDGIAVCDAWKDSFLSFYKDMGKRPSGRHSIERIDCIRGYEPGNVIWIDKSLQNRNKRNNNRNKRNNRMFTLNGMTKCLADWSDHLGISIHILRNRAHKGLIPPDLFKPRQRFPRKDRHCT